MIFGTTEWKRHLRVGREGWIRITPEDADDIWTLYNIISVGDEIEAMTIRRVIQENSAGDKVDSQKVKILLAVVAEKMDVDLKGASLRVNGKNIRENKHVKLGSYHTLDLEPGRDVKITKGSWDPISLEFLEATATCCKAEIGAVQFCDGLGFVCSLNPSTGVKILQRVEVAMPKKKLGSTSTLEKAQEKFNLGLLEAMLTNLNLASLRAIVLAAPGSLKDDYYKWMIDHLQKQDRKDVLEHKAKFIRVGLPGSSSASNLNPHNLMEVLKEPRIAELLADTKAAHEIKLLEQFHACNTNDPYRCTFGLKHVIKAADSCAIKHLLLSDSLFRSTDVKERQMYGKLIGEVKENGGKVMIFAPDTKPAEELDKLSGVAALLNFPVDFDEE